MLRRPTVPSNGAVMRMRCRRACASATWASATCRLAWLSSSTRCATKFSATSSWLRLKLARAIESWAWAWLSSARCSTSSSCTSNWPRRTRAPSAKAICATRPLTSGRSVTLWRERSVPTAWASSWMRKALTRVTSTPGMPAAPPARPARRSMPGPRLWRWPKPAPPGAGTTRRRRMPAPGRQRPPPHKASCLPWFEASGSGIRRHPGAGANEKAMYQSRAAMAWGSSIALTDRRTPRVSARHARVGGGVGTLVARVARVAFDPVPLDVVHAIVHQRIELLPQVGVLHRLFGGRLPALGLPAVDPLGDAFAHVLAVEVHRHLARPLEGGQALDHGGEFHAVVGVPR